MKCSDSHHVCEGVNIVRQFVVKSSVIDDVPSVIKKATAAQDLQKNRSTGEFVVGITKIGFGHYTHMHAVLI